MIMIRSAKLLGVRPGCEIRLYDSPGWRKWAMILFLYCECKKRNEPGLHYRLLLREPMKMNMYRVIVHQEIMDLDGKDYSRIKVKINAGLISGSWSAMEGYLHPPSWLFFMQKNIRKGHLRWNHWYFNSICIGLRNDGCAVFLIRQAIDHRFWIPAGFPPWYTSFPGSDSW